MNPSGWLVTEEQEQGVKEMQWAVAKHVRDKLLNIGLTEFQGLAFQTLAYSHALSPDTHIIKVIMARLLAEDEAGIRPAVVPEGGGGEKLKGKKRKRSAGPLKTQLHNVSFSQTALSQLFGLTETAQHDPTLLKEIRALGIVNRVNKTAIVLARLDIIRSQTRSLLKRSHVAKYSDGLKLLKLRGIFSVIKDLVAAEDKLTSEDLQRAEEFAGRSCRAFTKKGKESKLSRSDVDGLTSINRQPLKSTLGAMARTEGKYNQTNTCPGYGKKPQISICGFAVTFTADVWSTWANHKDNPAKEGDDSCGQRARRLSTEFVVLAAHRAVAKFREGDSSASEKALETFRAILTELDRGGILFDVITKFPDAMSVEGEAFFDDARLSIIKQVVTSEAAARDKEKAEQRVTRQGKDGGGRIKVRASTVSGTKTFEIDLPHDVLEAFGVMGANGRVNGRICVPLEISSVDGCEDDDVRGKDDDTSLHNAGDGDASKGGNTGQEGNTCQKVSTATRYFGRAMFCGWISKRGCCIRMLLFHPESPGVRRYI